MIEKPGNLPTINFRTAMMSDASAVASLRATFWSDQVSKGSIDHPDTEPAQLLLDSGSLIARVRTVVFVATDRNSIVGYILGQTKVLPGVVGSRISSIEEIFVEPSYRHLNVASSLVELAMAKFHIAGTERVQLRILDSNDGGKSFWRRVGFSPSVLIYEYSKPGSSTNS